MVDLISGGRLEFGLGSGAYQREFDRIPRPRPEGQLSLHTGDAAARASALAGRCGA